MKIATSQQPTSDMFAGSLLDAMPERDDTGTKKVELIIDDEFLKTRPLSKTSLIKFKRSPAHYIHYLTAPKEKTEALMLGSVVDCLTLTPNIFEKRFMLLPEINMRTNDGKAEYAKLLSEADGKELISPKLLAQATNMRDALLTNKKSAEYLVDIAIYAQRKLNWLDTESNLPMTGYTDFDADDPVDMLGELKTAANADIDEFSRDAYKFDYHIQAALYLEAFRKKLYRFPKFVFIVVEKEAPYGVSVFDKISPSFFKLGAQEVAKLRQQFRHCMKNDLFKSSYEYKSVDGGHLLDLPAYARQKIDD